MNKSLKLRLENFYENYFDNFIEKHSIYAADFYDLESVNRYVREGIKYDLQNNFNVINNNYELIDVDKDDEPLEYVKQLEYIENWINTTL